MTDSPRPGSPYQRPGSPYDGPTEQFPNSYPAYSGHSAYPPNNPTQQLPDDWAYATQYPPHEAPPPPQSPRSPKTPKWLWFVAGGAVLLVVGMVGALVITSGSSSDIADSTTSMRATEPTFSVPSRTSTAPPTTPSATPSPTPTGPTAAPPTTTGGGNGVTETVFYEVSGEGRAINITYVGPDNMMQTDFNVALPWSKEVLLEEPANETASVVIVNVGREVSCSVMVNGVVVSTNTGSGVTMCSRAVG